MAEPYWVMHEIQGEYIVFDKDNREQFCTPMKAEAYYEANKLNRAYQQGRRDALAEIEARRDKREEL